MSVEPLYLDVAGEGIFAIFHPAEAPLGAAVLILPLLGWEDFASHRARRDWAEHLARAGHPALRFDLPGTGDSGGGPEAANRVEAWIAATDAATRWLADRSGGRVAAIGIGLGGQLALQAAAAGAPIDQAVLWGVTASGTTLVRELRAFARMESATIVAAGAPEPPPPLPEGVLAPGGFLISAATTAALKTLTAPATTAPARVLLLERDGLPVDVDLRERLEAAGAEVTVAGGEGYGTMTGSPALAVAPRAAFATVDRWLGPPRPYEQGSADPALLELELGEIRERPFAVETPSGRLIGILSEPRAAPVPLTAVFLNAGAMRRIGPNRMWVEVARRWGAAGVPALRIDLAGIGDSEGASELLADGTGLYVPEYGEQIRTVLDALEAEGLPARFAVGGLCSGGYWAFQTALRDDRVVQALLLNSAYFEYDLALEGVRTLAKIRRRFLQPVSWRRLLRGEFRFALKFAAQALVRRPAAHDALGASLDALRERGARVDLVFSDGESLHDELKQLGPLDRWPNVAVELVPGRDHMFRPVWMHEHFYAAVDRTLARALDS